MRRVLAETEAHIGKLPRRANDLAIGKRLETVFRLDRRPELLLTRHHRRERHRVRRPDPYVKALCHFGPGMFPNDDVAVGDIERAVDRC